MWTPKNIGLLVLSFFVLTLLYKRNTFGVAGLFETTVGKIIPS